VGCGIRARAVDGRVREVRGDDEHPVNAGSLCAKGALIAEAIHDGRLLYPAIRRRRSSPIEKVSWEQALGLAADGIRKAIGEHGPDAVMLYGSGQLLTEDYYLFGKLAKGFLGTNNQDTNSRLCMSSTAAAYRLAFGSDAPPSSYGDIEAANTFLIVGSNMEACHPVLFNRVRARKRQGGSAVKVIVVDPRKTRTADIADLHLAVRPGTDVMLLNSLLYEAMLSGLIDEHFIAEHTSGWPALREALRTFPAERAAQVTGLDAQQIVNAARIYAGNGPALTFWTMGANQSTSGVDKNLALINLSLATGNIGKPGAGPFSLTGQPNAMGGREAGGLADSLPGHRQVGNPRHRAEAEQLWGIPAGSISARPGTTAMEMVDRLESGAIKVVWVVGTNPLASMPNAGRVKAAFARADTVIVQDAYTETETTAVADILFPAAQWSEREGTMTNSERRICLLEKIGDPPGEALPDWQIISRMAAALGYGASFDYSCAEAIQREYRTFTTGRDLDIAGLDYSQLRRQRQGVQWPAAYGSVHGTPRLFADGTFPTEDGRARFHIPQARRPADDVDRDYPLVLTTGRVKDQWHTRSRTGRVAKLNKSEPGPFLEVNPADAEALGLRQSELARVVSRRGSFEAPVRVTDAIRPGTVFAPFHWGELWSRTSSPNIVTTEAVDPRSKQPELKHAAVRLERLIGR